MSSRLVTAQDLSGISNIEFWKLARAKNPNFKNHTSEGTKDLFSERGFEALRQSDTQAINEYFELSIRIAFQKLDISRARNPLADIGLVEMYNTPNGGFVQRIAINSVKPITPKYKGLEDGMSIDPYVVRKSTQQERFFGQNFDYASLITIQDFQVKQIFLSDYGMGEFLAGIMTGFENGYKLQEYVNTKEALNTAINSTEYPLQDTQILEVPQFVKDAPTDANLKNLILTIKDLATAMKTQAQTGMYNANGFETIVDNDQYVCLMRAGIKNRIQMQLEVGAFNPDRLTIPFNVEEISDFGGLLPYYVDSTASPATETLLQEVYDVLGVVVGYVDASVTVNGYATKDAQGRWIVSVTSGSTTADTTIVSPDDVTWKDSNDEVIAIIAQKGLIFENRQNPYTVRPIYNPRGMYTNYWANSPNNAINVDPNYNLIVITAGAVTQATANSGSGSSGSGSGGSGNDASSGSDESDNEGNG